MYDRAIIKRNIRPCILGIFRCFYKGCWLKRKWMLFKASYFKLKWFLYRYWSKRIRVLSHGFIFPRYLPARVAFIFMLLSPVRKKEREVRISVFFLSFLFFSISPWIKNTLNPFWDMLRIRTNRLLFSFFFFFLSLHLGLQAEWSLSFSLTH